MYAIEDNHYLRFICVDNEWVISHKFHPIDITNIESASNPRPLRPCYQAYNNKSTVRYEICNVEYTKEPNVVNNNSRVHSKEIIAWYIHSFSPRNTETICYLPAGLRWIRKSLDKTSPDYNILVPAGSNLWPHRRDLPCLWNKYNEITYLQNKMNFTNPPPLNIHKLPAIELYHPTNPSLIAYK